jgi:hypothetical protein
MSKKTEEWKYKRKTEWIKEKWKEGEDKNNKRGQKRKERTDVKTENHCVALEEYREQKTQKKNASLEI